MSDRWLAALTLICAVGTGLVGGTFFAFSSFVMRALSELGAEQGTAAMQSINLVILRSPFIPVMMGTAAIGLGLSVVSLARWREPASAWLLGGGVLYLLGAILVTIVFNVPRNDALASGGPHDIGAWPAYLAEWTAWNHVRTVAAVAAMAAYVVAFAQLRAP